MKKAGWSFIFITAKSFSRVRQISISGFMIGFLVLFIAAGLVGLVRIFWFTTSFCGAKFGVYDARQDNEGLLLKVKFLSKYSDKETQQVNELISFEDKTRLQYGLSRISNDVRMAGVGGLPTKEDMILASLLDPVLMNAEIVKENIESLIRKAELQDSTLTKMTEQVESIHKVWSSRPSIWPTVGRITSGFGYRMHPVVGENMFHEGLDIANKPMTLVYATAEGIVEHAGPRDYYGNAIFLKHLDNQAETIYGHLNKIAVKYGQHVKRGELIGYMGNTGRTTGPHLHYEVRIFGKCVNPLGYILPSDAIID
jgi:murein DD-endopeptidase MepM/ murein hydrolase activator NlpD